jgi:hypothetical protein
VIHLQENEEMPSIPYAPILNRFKMKVSFKLETSLSKEVEREEESGLISEKNQQYAQFNV